MTLNINLEDWTMKVVYGLIVLIALIALGIVAATTPVTLLLLIVIGAGWLIDRLRE